MARQSGKKRIATIVLIACVLPLWAIRTSLAAVRTGIDEEARLPYWELTEPGISLRLVQRLPDQSRGFFQARGFSIADAEYAATQCVFQTIFRNVLPAASGGIVEYDLREWVVHAAGRPGALKTREDWKAEWQARQVQPVVQLAFEWGLIPTRQRYAPGDYNWGFTFYGLAPNSLFDLDVVWHQNGERRQASLQGVRCAPDIHPDPEPQ